MEFVHQLLDLIGDEMGEIDTRTLNNIERILPYPAKGEVPIFRANLQLQKVLAYYLTNKNELDRMLNEGKLFSQEDIMMMITREAKVDIAKALVKLLIDMESMGRADASYKTLQVKQGWHVYGSTEEMEGDDEGGDFFHFTRTTH